MLLAPLALITHFALPVDLGTIDLQRARALSGRVVVAEFLNVAEPFAYPEWEITTIGPANREDGAERVAVLRGRRS